jgi:hypothetical protein
VEVDRRRRLAHPLGHGADGHGVAVTRLVEQREGGVEVLVAQPVALAPLGSGGARRGFGRRYGRPPTGVG